MQHPGVSPCLQLHSLKALGDAQPLGLPVSVKVFLSPGYKSCSKPLHTESCWLNCDPFMTEQEPQEAGERILLALDKQFCCSEHRGSEPPNWNQGISHHENSLILKKVTVLAKLYKSCGFVQ